MRKIANNDLLKQVFKKYHAKFGPNGYEDAKLGLASLIADPVRSEKYSKATVAKIAEYVQRIIDKYDDILSADHDQLKQLITDFNTIIPLHKMFKRFWSEVIDLSEYDKVKEGEFIQFVQRLQVTEAEIDVYIHKIIDEYDDIILADQAKMIQLRNEFNAIIALRRINKALWTDIVEVMNYEKLREKEFIQLVQELGIRTCIYCQAQLTVVINKEFYKINRPDIPAKRGDVMTRRGLLELDHRHAKSKYPFLCTSFYNLYPTCGNCNRIKSSKDSTFDLYCDLDDLEVFQFSVDKDSIVECLTHEDKDLLKIEIKWTNISDVDANNFLDMFDIKEIYDTQKDIVEELVHKKVVYTDKYKKELHEEFLGLFPNPAMLNRLIVGNYDQPEEIYKRPLSKFMQDIARDIGLISKSPSKKTL